MIGTRIVCAALQHSHGSLIVGPRHFDSIMRQQIKADGREWHTAVQGFIDQQGNFFTRKQARLIALSACQIIRRCGGDETELFSENLY